jgi:hypothetical protein
LIGELFCGTLIKFQSSKMTIVIRSARAIYLARLSARRWILDKKSVVALFDRHLLFWQKVTSKAPLRMACSLRFVE